MTIRLVHKLIADVVASLEDQKNPFSNYIITFFSVVMIRQFFESYSQKVNVFDLLPVDVSQNYYHYTLFYVTLAMLMSILMHYATSTPIEKVSRVILPCSILLLLAPLLDILMTGGVGFNIYYLQPGLNIDMWRAYYAFGSQFDGMSMGMKIEEAIMLFCVFLYLRNKQCSILKSVFFTWCVYTLIFAVASSPFIVSHILGIFGQSYKFSEILFIRYYLIIIFIASFWIAYIANRNIFKMVLSSMRVDVIAYAELTLLLGATFAMSIQYYSTRLIVRINPQAVIGIVLSMMSVFFVILFLTMISSVYSTGIHKVKALKENHYKTIAYISMGIALFYASLVNGKVVLIVTVIMGAGYVYFAAPLRLNRVPVLSKLVVSLGSFALILIGFLLVQRTTFGFPHQLMWIYFVGVSLAANFMDLKTAASDVAAGVVTLPTMVGSRAARLIIGMTLFFVCLSFHFILPDPRLIPVLACAGAGFFYLSNKQNFDDCAVMRLVNASLFAMIFYLILGA